jgi:hypothetical protein
MTGIEGYNVEEEVSCIGNSPLLLPPLKKMSVIPNEVRNPSVMKNFLLQASEK